MNDQERRQAWREPDGFAKAADQEKPKRSWEDRMRDSILIKNTGSDPITLEGLDGIGRQVAPGESVEYIRRPVVPPPDPKVVKEILDAEGPEPTGMLTGGPSEVPIFLRGMRSPLFVQLALGFYTQIDFQPPPYPAQREICAMMVKLGMIKEDPVEKATIMHYVPVHEALKAYVDALCRVPTPVRRWVIP